MWLPRLFRGGAAAEDTGGRRVIPLPAEPLPQQLAFFRSSGRYRFRLYGGARGGGKSWALRWDAIYTSLGFPGNKYLILRRNFPDLRRNQILNFLEECPRELYRWSWDDKTAYFHNSSTIEFGHLDTDNDWQKYQGAEYNQVGFDEITQFGYTPWSKLIGSNRHGRGSRVSMVATGNPGGIGHAWVRALFIRKHKDELGVCEGLKPERYDPDDYFFQPAKATDNPHNNEEYVQDLFNLPDTLRAAWLDGNWDLVAGQFFDCWNDGCMVDGVIIPTWWRRWISIDWGYQHEAVALWHAADPEGRNVVTYRELAVNRTTPTELATEIARLNNGEQVSRIYLSPDAFARRTTERTIALDMGEVFRGCGLPYPIEAEDNRVSGWALMYDFLKSGRWKIVRPNAAGQGCKRLCHTITLAQRDVDKNPEDVIKFTGDDSIDAGRYGINVEWLRATEPIELVIRRRIEGAEDATSRAIMARRIQAEMQKARRPIVLRRAG